MDAGSEFASELALEFSLGFQRRGKPSLFLERTVYLELKWGGGVACFGHEVGRDENGGKRSRGMRWGKDFVFWSLLGITVVSWGSDYGED